MKRFFFLIFLSGNLGAMVVVEPTFFEILMRENDEPRGAQQVEQKKESSLLSLLKNVWDIKKIVGLIGGCSLQKSQALQRDGVGGQPSCCHQTVQNGAQIVHASTMNYDLVPESSLAKKENITQ